MPSLSELLLVETFVLPVGVSDLVYQLVQVMERKKEKQKRYHSVSAIVGASFNVGICSNLLHLDESEKGGLASSSNKAKSHPNLAASLSPILSSRRALQRFPSDASSPSPAEVDSPDCVFKSSKAPSKFGLFSALKGRRSSSPVAQQSPRREVRFKSDLLTVPEQKYDQRQSAAVSHAPVRIVVSSSEAEFGSNKLRRRREFGSTGDLLKGSTELKSSLKHYLGKSMEHVSDQ